MRVAKEHRHGDVRSLEVGSNPLGRVLMTTRLYLIGDVLIDTGHSMMEKAVLDYLAGRNLRALVLTHHHEDHCGNAAAIAERFSIPIFGHSITAEKLKSKRKIMPYQRLVWGPAANARVRPAKDRMEFGPVCLEPSHCPGHSPDMTVWLDKDHGRLFSGDLFLGERIKFFRSDEKIDAQILSLKKALALDFDALLCGHHPVLKNGKAKLKAKLAFLEDFLGRVARMRDKGMDLKAIMKSGAFREDWFIRLLSMGNVSRKMMARSCLNAIERRRAG
ncbi:MBL fold metallo-hydrolase [Candidatus Desulfarcum epimagneticum]|uniref:MBL fold metallo-hydrolase n=1 Tax=uncultured Desulfobacteraceae bacterium TaxID=218296 RepID=A0A484HKA9_9BACT|nr:MBL fold metallo-hydrolase [uncultured Desulfobacteraceae bacterium]